MREQLIIVGVGRVGRSLLAQARGRMTVIGTTRDPRKVFYMVEEKLIPLVMPLPSAEVLASVARDNFMVVCYPPDRETDQILAPVAAVTRRTVYLSSTVVYGQTEGIINDHTSALPSCPPGTERLYAEREWQQYGGVVLRAPAIYGPESGLHLSLRNGRYRLPGDGLRIVSRIHIEDLSRVIMAAVTASSLQRNCYVVGDGAPCSQREIVTWLCSVLDLPLPASAPLEEVPRSLRGNRSVDGTGIITELGLKLKYPDYRQGYRALLELRS